MLIPSVLKAAVVAAPMLVASLALPPARPDATRHVERAAYQSLASRTGMTPAQLGELRSILDRTARISKRKGKAVELRRLILAALETNSEAEYRAINRQLRSKLATRAKTRHYGRFLTGAPAIRDDADRKPGGPAVAELCTTEEGGVTYTDECLTDEEKADNAVWADALYTETIADFDEGSDDCYANSSDPGNECEWATSPAPSPAASSRWLGPVDQSPSAVDGEGLEACPQSGGTVGGTEGLGPSFGCVEKALTATAGIAAFGASCANFFGKYANTVWAAARAAGNASRVTLVVAAFGLGYTIGSYINCINGWEMLEAPEQFSPEIPWNEPAFSFSP